MADTSDITRGNLPLATFATTSTILCTPTEDTLLYCNDAKITCDISEVLCNALTYPNNLVDVQICIPGNTLPLTGNSFDSISDDISFVALGNLPLTNYANNSLVTDLTDLPLGELILDDRLNPQVILDDTSDIPNNNLPLTSYIATGLLTDLTDIPNANLPLDNKLPSAIADDVSNVQLGALPLTPNTYLAKSDDIISVVLGNLPLTGNTPRSAVDDIVHLPVNNLPLTNLRIISTLEESTLCIIGGLVDVLQENYVKVVNTRANKVAILKNNPVVVVQDSDPIMVVQDPVGKIVQTDYIILNKVYEGEDEQEIMYSKRVDFIDDSLLYRGEAEPGTLNTQSFWRIRKITISDIDDDVVEIWANGDDNFDKVWDNRLLYAYS